MPDVVENAIKPSMRIIRVSKAREERQSAIFVAMKLERHNERHAKAAIPMIVFSKLQFAPSWASVADDSHSTPVVSIDCARCVCNAFYATTLDGLDGVVSLVGARWRSCSSVHRGLHWPTEPGGLIC